MIHTVKFVIFYNELVSHTEVCPADAAVEAGEMVGASSQLHHHLEGGDGPPAHLTLPGHSEQSHVVASTEQQPELDIQAGAGLCQPHPAAGAGEAVLVPQSPQAAQVKLVNDRPATPEATLARNLSHHSLLGD